MIERKVGKIEDRERPKKIRREKVGEGKVSAKRKIVG